MFDFLPHLPRLRGGAERARGQLHTTQQKQVVVGVGGFGLGLGFGQLHPTEQKQVIGGAKARSGGVCTCVCVCVCVCVA